MKNKRTFLILLSILLLGISIRIYNLNDKCFWLDEIATLLMSSGQSAEEITSFLFFENDFSPNQLEYFKKILLINKSSPLKNIINLLRIDAFPPLYLILIHYWRCLFGNSEFALRLFSVLWGVASIPFIYLIGKKIYNKDIGLLTAAIFAVAPFQVYYSQEARMYSFLTFLLLISSWTVIKLTWRDNDESAKKLLLLLFLIVSVAGIYTHYFYAAVLVFQNMYFIIKKLHKKDELLNWLIIQGVILITFSPWIFIIIEQYSFMQISWGTNGQFYDGMLPLVKWIKDILICYIELVVFLGIKNKDILIILVTPIIFFGALQLAKQRKTSLLIITWGIIPTIFIIILDFFLKTHFSAISIVPFNRYLFFAAPPIYFLVALCINTLYKKNRGLGFALAAIILVFLLLSSLFVVNTECVTKSKRYYEAAAYLDKTMEKNDLLLIFPHWGILSISYYLRRNIDILPIHHKSIAKVQQRDIKGRKAIWLLISYIYRKDTSSWLDQNFLLVEKRKFKGLVLSKYLIH